MVYVSNGESRTNIDRIRLAFLAFRAGKWRLCTEKWLSCTEIRLVGAQNLSPVSSKTGTETTETGPESANLCSKRPLLASFVRILAAVR
jgi:hypothetical protein